MDSDDRQMSNSALLKVGIVGTIVAAVCCFTPVVVVLLGVVGLAFLNAWLDYLVLPSLVFFLVITGYALWKRRAARSS
jgi:mercuric ion transport protein